MDDTQTSKASDVAATRKRRSSILKSQRPPRTPFSELEFNVATPTETSKNRRVSFSRRTGVAEFATNEGTTTWKNFYEEHNKSLETSGNETAASSQRQVAHLGRRIFEQQFEELEAVDCGGEFLSTSRNQFENCTNNDNFTQQFAALESTEDDGKLTAPAANYDISALTETQQKLFKDDITIPTMGGTISGQVDVDFSLMQPIESKCHDDLDIIQDDLKESLKVVGPTAFSRQDLSEYIEVDLNMTQLGPGNDQSDMSITDTVHSPKVQEVSKIKPNSSLSKKSIMNADCPEDKENIAINPFITPCETDNFAVLDDSDKVLVFDGKRLTMQSEKKSLVIHQSPVKVEPLRRKAIVLNTDDDLPNFITAPANELVSSVVFDSELSLTQGVNSKVLPKRRTMVFEDSSCNISMTQALPAQVIVNKDNHRTICESNDISITKTVNTNIYDSRKEIAQGTIIYDSNNISFTQALSANVIMSNQNQTVHFQNSMNDISMTQGLPQHIIQNIRRKTICKEDDISMTQAVPTNILLNNDTAKTEYFDDNIDISMTQAIPNNLLIQQSMNEKQKTIIYINNEADLSVTEVIKTNIIPNAIKESEQINHDMTSNNISTSALDNKPCDKTDYIADNMSITHINENIMNIDTPIKHNISSINKENNEICDASKLNLSKPIPDEVIKLGDDIDHKQIISDKCELLIEKHEVVVLQATEFNVSNVKGTSRGDTRNCDSETIEGDADLQLKDSVDKEKCDVNKLTMDIYDEEPGDEHDVDAMQIGDESVDTSLNVIKDKSIKNTESLQSTAKPKQTILNELLDMSLASDYCIENRLKLADKRNSLNTNETISPLIILESLHPIEPILDNSSKEPILNTTPSISRIPDTKSPTTMLISDTKVTPTQLISDTKQPIPNSKSPTLPTSLTPDISPSTVATEPKSPTLAVELVADTTLSTISALPIPDTSPPAPPALPIPDASPVTPPALPIPDTTPHTPPALPIPNTTALTPSALPILNTTPPTPLTPSALPILNTTPPTPPAIPRPNTTPLTPSALPIPNTTPPTPPALPIPNTTPPTPPALSIQKITPPTPKVLPIPDTTPPTPPAIPIPDISPSTVVMPDTNTNSNESLFLIIRDSNEQINEAKNEKSNETEHNVESDLDINLVDNVQNKIAELKTAARESKLHSNRHYESVLSPDLKEKPKDFAVKEELNISKKQRYFKDADDTRELLKMLSEFTDANNDKSDDEKPKDATEIFSQSKMDKSQRGFASRRSLALTREEMMSNISMAQAILHQSQYEFNEDDTVEDATYIPDDTIEAEPVRKSNRISSDVVKSLHFDDSIADSKNIEIPLKKTAFGETCYVKDILKDKSRVIPTYDFTDGIKELMSDLVKPMADVLPFQSNNLDRSLRKSPSKASTQIQANLMGSSQIDLDLDLHSYTGSGNLNDLANVIAEEGNRSVCSALKDSVSPVSLDVSMEDVNKHKKEIDRVEEFKKQVHYEDADVEMKHDHICEEKLNRIVKRPDSVLVFDHHNPLNNVALSPKDFRNVHKYEPIKSRESIKLEQDLSVQYMDASLIEIGTVVTQYNVAVSTKPVSDASQSLTGVESQAFSVDHSTDALPMNVKDEEINTMIVMKQNKDLLDANSSLTLVDDKVKDVFDVTITASDSSEVSQKSPLRVIYKMDEFGVLSKKAESDAAKTDEESDEKSRRKRIYSPNRDQDERTPKPVCKFQKISSSKKMSPERKIEKKLNSSKMDHITVQQLLTEFDIKNVDRKICAKEIESALKESCMSIVSETILKSDPILCGKACESPGSGVTIDCRTSDTEWQIDPISGKSSKNLVEECESSFNVVAKIDTMPFMGSRDCEWESSANDIWSFLLLRSHLRLSVRLAHSYHNSSRSRVRADTPLLSVCVDPVKPGDTEPLVQLCVRFATESMRFQCSRFNCQSAGEVPALLRRCVVIARLALQWARAMRDARLRLAYDINADGFLTLKVANIPLRSVWEISMRIELLVEDAADAAWPSATSIDISTIVADMNIPRESLRRVVKSVPQDWGHAPRAIWKIFRYLKNKTRDDDICSLNVFDREK